MSLALLLCSLAFDASALGKEPKKLVIIGDSITEGYGVSHDQAYPSLLQKKLESAGKNWRVVNSGISGSTAASAVTRTTWILKQKPDLVILALGGNDGLRGAPVKSLERNLAEAVDLCQKASVPVVLAGMKLPPNLGAVYTKQFEKAFETVAREKKVPLIPFLLENVGGVKELNLPDGIHPNEKGHVIVAQTVLKAIEKLL